MKYSAAFKTKMVQKMLAGRSASSLAREAGLHQPTLSKWLRDASSVAAVKRQGKNEDPKTEGRRPDDWSAEEKLEAVVEAKRVSESELGEFLRRRGLHEEHLRQWEAAAVESLRARRAPGKSAEVKRVKELERELRRKEKALAEAAGLLVLRKNNHGRRPTSWTRNSARLRETPGPEGAAGRFLEFSNP